MSRRQRSQLARLLEGLRQSSHREHPEAEKLLALLEQLEAASQAPAQGEVPRRLSGAPAQPSRELKSVQRCKLQEAQIWEEKLRVGEPVLVVGALSSLTGQKVLEFMPKLMTFAARQAVTYEEQADVGSERGEMALGPFVQLIQQAGAGRALLMFSDTALQAPELRAFVTPPQNLGPSEALRLVMGGAGARTRLVQHGQGRWSFLVLGKAKWRLLPPRTKAEDVGGALGASGFGVSTLNSFQELDDRSGSCSLEVLEAVQEMGEALLVPAGWWQQANLEDRYLAVEGCLHSKSISDGGGADPAPSPLQSALLL